MTARPPRATTKGDGRRPRPRGATHGERADKRRSASVSPTDRFERVGDDEVMEVLEVPSVPQLRVLALEPAAQMAAVQAAITSAGHVLVSGALGGEGQGLDRLRPVLGGVDALVIGLPGGEPLIELAQSLGPARPVIIASSTASAVEAARRAAAVGADLAVVRPHHVERLAPVLFAAARLGAERRAAAAALAALAEREPGGLLPLDEFQRAVEAELARAARNAYPLAIALFAVEVAPAAPPPAMRGILRARAGNALVHALRDIDLVTELDGDRFLVLFPYTDRGAAAEVARRLLGAVAAGDPVVSAGRAYAPRLVGAVTGARPEAPASFAQLVEDAAQLLEQAAVTGASLAVES